MVTIRKKDIAWSYFAQFFVVISGLIILPIILHWLSTEEIAMNYLMLTISSLVTLFDFGFSPQFGRSISYVFSGVKELQKEGVGASNEGGQVDYKLLVAMIQSARYVYLRLGLIVLILMLSLGTWYMYDVTDGFSNVRNSLFIWVIFSISTFFNIYYSYYNSLLTGRGLIMEYQRAMVYSKIVYIFLACFLLLLGWGLIGVTLANLISPFLSRYLSYKYFFTRDLLNKINSISVSKYEILNVFKVIWHNSKKMGLVVLATYATKKSSLFFAGLFLSMADIASYGLMIQLVGLVSSISMTLLNTYQPRFASLHVKNDRLQLLNSFAFNMTVFYVLFILGSLFIILLGPFLLSLVQSNAVLPPIWIMILYFFISFVGSNQSGFTIMIATKNNIPFVLPYIFTGIIIIVGNFLTLKFTTLGILGLILVQGIFEFSYNNWKWPTYVLNEMNISYWNLIEIGYSELRRRILLLVRY